MYIYDEAFLKAFYLQVLLSVELTVSSLSFKASQYLKQFNVDIETWKLSYVSVN